MASDSVRSPIIDVVPVAVVATTVGLAVATVRRGGFGSASFATMLAFVAIALVSSSTLRAVTSSLRLSSGLVAPVVGSTLVSAVVAGDLHRSIPTVALLAGFAAVIAVGLAVAPAERSLSLDLVVGVVGLLVAATAWFGLASHREPWGREADLLWRGSSSLTYSNAAAAVVGPLCLFTIWRVMRVGIPQMGSSLRSRATLLTFVGYLLAVGLGATLSRGGVAAFGVGFVVLAILERRQWVALVATSCAVLVPAMVALVVPVASAPVAQDPRFGLCALALVAGGVASVVMAMWLAGATSAGHLRVRRMRLVSVSGVALALAVVVMVQVVPGVLDDVMSSRVRVWSPQSSGEGDTFLGDRGSEWSAALDQIGERPLLGHGPGGVDLVWESDGRALRARFVHNEYLEFAVTHGVVGLAALLGSTAMAVRWWRRRAQSIDGGSSAGVAAMMVAFLSHSAVDPPWPIPVLPLLFGFVVVLALPAGRNGALPSEL